MKHVYERWSVWRHILQLGLPLIVSAGSVSVLHWMDRAFLSRHNPVDVAAALPAGSVSFAIAALFMSWAGYVGTLVAQSVGEGKPERVGPVVMQGVWLAWFSVLTVPLQWWIAPYLFGPFGHSPEVLAKEIEYFRILSIGMVPLCWSAALSGFFSGLGRTRTILWANLWMCTLNGIAAYGLIFGAWGLPEMGLRGAAWATTCAQGIPMVVYSIAMWRLKDRKFYGLGSWKLDFSLFRTLSKYGFPAGLHTSVDVTSFALFMLLAGSLPIGALAANNIAFQIHLLGFLPAIGLGFAISILVGQAHGAKDLHACWRWIRGGLELTLLYTSVVAALYLLIPGLLLMPFARVEDGDWAMIAQTATALLGIAAVLAVFDFLQVVFSSALKGAGDTKAVMWILGIASIFGLVLPAAWVRWSGGGVVALWWVMALYVALLSALFAWRLWGGRWMRRRIFDRA